MLFNVKRQIPMKTTIPLSISKDNKHTSTIPFINKEKMIALIPNCFQALNLENVLFLIANI